MFSPDYDTIIVGAGLAGSAAAWYLSQSHRVLVLDASSGHGSAGTSVASGTSASSVSAGLFNPLMAQKANPIWRADEALEAFLNLVDASGAGDCVAATGVLRPALNERQASFYQKSATQNPDLGTWLSKKESEAHHPAVSAPFGALVVYPAGSVDMKVWCQHLVQQARIQFGASSETERLKDWREENGFVHARTSSGQTYTGRRLLLCCGYGLTSFPFASHLLLHPIKGQVIRVRPVEPVPDFPPTSAGGYAVPSGQDIILGSTYEHTFSSLEPEKKADLTILRKILPTLPFLEGAETIERKAGIRMTVPRTRLPMVGPLPGCHNVWVFSGLGSKGLLMAPLVAKSILKYLQNPSLIPDEIRIRLAPNR